MINWDGISYDINQASKDFSLLEVNRTSVDDIRLIPEFVEIRNKMIDARDNLYDEYGFDSSSKLDYKFDLLYGIELYKILDEDCGFSNRVASNDDIWRYISIKVIPDIVHARWGLNEDHFYKTSRRIWLKTIWWYIHLSWSGSSEMTYKILKDNSTDTILQLVERPGIGYHVDMYRELMKQYSYHDDPSRQLFRRVLKINTAKLMTVNPEVVPGGVEKYVSEMFELVVDNHASL